VLYFTCNRWVNVREGTVSQLIAMKFGKRISLTYVINFAKCGVFRSQGCEQSNIRVLSLLEKPSLTLPCANAQAVIIRAHFRMSPRRKIRILANAWASQSLFLRVSHSCRCRFAGVVYFSIMVCTFACADRQ